MGRRTARFSFFLALSLGSVLIHGDVEAQYLRQILTLDLNMDGRPPAWAGPWIGIYLRGEQNHPFPNVYFLRRVSGPLLEPIATRWNQVSAEEYAEILDSARSQKCMDRAASVAEVQQRGNHVLEMRARNNNKDSVVCMLREADATLFLNRMLQKYSNSWPASKKVGIERLVGEIKQLAEREREFAAQRRQR